MTKITQSKQNQQENYNFCEIAKQVIAIEQQAITALGTRIDQQFARACECLLNCQGRVIITGIGKSGHIGKKIAATLASTGTPAFFVHPAEASHGDLGMITRQDVVVAISKSGSTEEILTIIPLIKRLGIPLISMTGNTRSSLAKISDIHLDISVEKEACTLDLAPTSSTTVTLVLGDALAIALLNARGFTEEHFALSHPGGKLGRQLLLKVADLMHKGHDIPKVTPTTLLSEALVEITKKRLGVTTVVDDDQHLLGIFTDGDLRRTLEQAHDIHKTIIETVMTRHSKTVSQDTLVAEAIKIMEDHTITSLVVTDEKDKVVGIIHMHDLLKADVA